MLLFFVILSILLLCLKLDLEVIKKENTYIEIRFLKFIIFKKYLRKSNNKKNKKVKIFDIAAKNKKFLIKEVENFVKTTIKKIEIIISNFSFQFDIRKCLNATYVIVLLYILFNILKNYENKINVNCKYAEQKEFIKFKFHIKIRVRLINIVIVLLKLLIIYNRVIKKGMSRNGRKTNRKFDDDRHVFN